MRSFPAVRPPRSSVRRWRWAAALAFLLVSGRAEAAGKRIGVPEFAGAQEAAVRLKVMQTLAVHGYEPVRARDLQEAMTRTGAGLETDDDLKALAKDLALSAIVTGEVGARRAKIVVHDGGEGSILGNASFSGANPRKLAEEVGLSFWMKLGPDVERGQLPAGAKKRKASAEVAAANDESAPGGGAHGEDDRGEAAASKPNDEAPAEEVSESDEAPRPKRVKKKRRFRMEDEVAPEETGPRALPPANPWLDLELGGGGLNRSLTFNQNVVVQGSALLQPYRLGVGPIGTAKVVLFPWQNDKVGNFGVEGEIRQGLGISSARSTGGSFSDTVHEYAAGFRYRVLFATAGDVFFSLTFGEDAFTFSGPDRSSLLIPDTIYHYTRGGAGMHLAIAGGLGVSFGGGYRYIDNHGGPQISQEVFPHLTVAGADADGVVRYALNATVELRAGLEWRRYWYAMHSQLGDRVVAGGAVDQSFDFTAGIAGLLGVGDSPKAEGESQAPSPPRASVDSSTNSGNGRDPDE